MKLYPNLISAAIEGLTEIFNQNKKADKVVAKLLKSNNKWGSRDRKFIANNIYSVVRWYRLYHEVLGKEPETTEEWKSLLGIQWILKGEDISAYTDFDIPTVEEIQNKAALLSKNIAIKESIPEWLHELGTNELGDKWSTCLTNLNEPQHVYLRVNTLKNSGKAALNSLKKEGISASMENQFCIKLEKRAKLEHLKSFRNGLYELQDKGSQLISAFLNPTPGTTVIDACAGAGGKTLHLASIMKNKGEITALDIRENALKELEKRCLRAGVIIVNTKLAEEETITKLKESADYLLLDAPCSGLGVLKRNPDAKWKLTPEFIQTIKTTQQEIITSYSSMVKKGGSMVYATCSILPSENEDQVQTFLESTAGKDFSLVKQESVFPGKEDFDGFYMALLKKNQNPN